jgi:hypothetical protein
LVARAAGGARRPADLRTGRGDVPGRDGAPLDLHRTFSADDDRDVMRHFLEESGYLHIQGVFTEEEMGAVSDDMDRAARLRAVREAAPVTVSPPPGHTD